MTIRTLSRLIYDLRDSLTGETVTLGAILTEFHERGFGVFLLFFAAPMALPIPVPPGINILLASPLLILTAQQALGRHTIWMPRHITRKTLSCQKLNTMLDALIPWMKKLEKLVKPRLGSITQNGPSRLIGLLGFIMALSVCIPLPLTNTIPSLGIALMAIGVTMRDGLAVIVGALIGMTWVIMLLSVLIMFGTEAIEIIKETIKVILHL